MAKGRKATPQEAQLVLQLYDLRRDPVMRAARKYIVSEFWPQNYDEFKAVLTAYGSEQHTWMRQVLTYWDMAAALVLQGALSEQLFFETSGEPYFLWAKFGAYIPQARKDHIDQEFLVRLEKVVGTPQGRKRVKGLQERVATRRAQTASAAKAGK